MKTFLGIQETSNNSRLLSKTCRGSRSTSSILVVFIDVRSFQFRNQFAHRNNAGHDVETRSLKMPESVYHEAHETGGHLQVPTQLPH